MGRCVGNFGTVWVTVAVSAFSQVAQAQAPAGQAESLKQTLIAVGDGFGLNPVKSGPFHLKAHFETFGADGKPDSSGTLDEYGDGKDRLRRELTYRGKTQTVWWTPTRSASGEDLHAPFYVRRLLAAFEHPLPPASALEDLTFEDKQEAMGPVRMHCILTRRKPQPGHSRPDETGRLGPLDEDDFCLSTDDRYLRVEEKFPELAFAYNGLYRFNGQIVPFAVTVTQGGQTRSELHVDALQSVQPEGATFLPAPDAKAVPGAGDDLDIVQLPANVADDNNVDKRRPSYPPIAKQAHVAGTVLMAAIISKQGTVQDLEVINSADRMLVPAALDAVKDWRYKPFTLHGVPVEVDTIIPLNFAFGSPPPF